MDQPDSLIAAIAADPDAVDNWIVYADWLSEREDPRGELITLELAIEARAASPEAIERHRKLARDEVSLLSPRLADVSHHLALTMRRGFVRAARVFGPPDEPPTSEVLAALFEDPHACLLAELDLGPHAELLQRLERSCNTVRELSLDGSVAIELPLAARFPMLEGLTLEGSQDDFDGARLGAALELLEHPHLTTLAGTCSALRTGRFELPRLRELSIATDPLDLFAAGAILANPPPLLVVLWVPTTSPALLRALRGSPVCAQLETLVITVDNSTVIDELALDPEPFRHLELVCVAGVATVAQRDAMIARITALNPRARFQISAMEERDVSAPPMRG